MAKKEVEWVNNAFSRITALEGGRVAMQEELNILRENLENLKEELQRLKEKPPGKLQAVQPGPDKAAERRRELAEKKRNVVLPQ